VVKTKSSAGRSLAWQAKQEFTIFSPGLGLPFSNYP